MIYVNVKRDISIKMVSVLAFSNKNVHHVKMAIILIFKQDTAKFVQPVSNVKSNQTHIFQNAMRKCTRTSYLRIF